MPAKQTPGDAYRKLKLRRPECLLAFGVGSMIEFVRSDAREVARLAQEQIVRPGGYDAVVIHSAKFFSLVRRLNCMGKSIMLIARQTSPSGKWVYFEAGMFKPNLPGTAHGD